jgi:hypothetical protein
MPRRTRERRPSNLDHMHDNFLSPLIEPEDVRFLRRRETVVAFPALIVRDTVDALCKWA